MEKFSEATVGFRANKEIAEKWVQLFNTSYFMVSAVSPMHALIISLLPTPCGDSIRFSRLKYHVMLLAVGDEMLLDG